MADTKEKDQGKKSSKKPTKPKSENLPALQDEEIFILEVDKLLRTHPLFKEEGLPADMADYLVDLLRRQPELKRLTHIERREHLLNIFALGYIRDAIMVDFGKARAKHGRAWQDFFEPKFLRIVKDAIKQQEAILPILFKETGEGFDEVEAGKRIIRAVYKAEVEFEEKRKPKEDIIDADYKVVEEDGSQKDS